MQIMDSKQQSPTHHGIITSANTTMRSCLVLLWRWICSSALTTNAVQLEPHIVVTVPAIQTTTTTTEAPGLTTLTHTRQTDGSR